MTTARNQKIIEAMSSIHEVLFGFLSRAEQMARLFDVWSVRREGSAFRAHILRFNRAFATCLTQHGALEDYRRTLVSVKGENRLAQKHTTFLSVFLGQYPAIADLLTAGLVARGPIKSWVLEGLQRFQASMVLSKREKKEVIPNVAAWSEFKEAKQALPLSMGLVRFVRRRDASSQVCIRLADDYTSLFARYKREGGRISLGDLQEGFNQFTKSSSFGDEKWLTMPISEQHDVAGLQSGEWLKTAINESDYVLIKNRFRKLHPLIISVVKIEKFFANQLLINAIALNDCQLAYIAIHLGCDLNQIKMTETSKPIFPLFSAVKRDFIPLAKLLIQHGANLNQKNSEGRTIFDCLLSAEFCLHKNHIGWHELAEHVATLLTSKKPVVKTASPLVSYSLTVNREEKREDAQVIASPKAIGHSLA